MLVCASPSLRRRRRGLVGLAGRGRLPLLIELVVAALTSAWRGFEASSFVEEGGKPRSDRSFLVSDRGRTMLQDENMHLPDYRRHDLAHRTDQQGSKVSEVIVQEL
jgi:hypothetical protein